MGPARVDPLAHARLIVAECIERDSLGINAAHEPPGGVPARAFGRPRVGLRAQAPSTAFSSLDGDIAAPSDRLTTQVDSTAILVLSFIVVVIACVAARTLMLHF